MKFNKSDLVKAAQAANIPQITGKTGKYSISVVNSDGNGKRITLSKSLVEKLRLDGSVSVLPLGEEGALLMSKELSYPCTSEIELGSKDGRTAYNAEAVKMIVDDFGLDYSGGRTSMSVSDIEFCQDDDAVVAVVHIPKMFGSATGEEKGEQSA